MVLCLLYLPIYTVEGSAEEKEVTTELEEKQTEKTDVKLNVSESGTDALDELEAVPEQNEKKPEPIYSLSGKYDGGSLFIDSEAGFDKNTVLEVEDYAESSSSYTKYIKASVDFTGRASDFTYGKVLDVSLLMDENNIELNNVVRVTVSLDEKLVDADVLYFEENSKTPKVVLSKVNGNDFTFETDDLGVYVIISGPYLKVEKSDTEESSKEEPKKEVKDEDKGSSDEEVDNRKGVKAPKVSEPVRAGHSSHESSDLEDFLSNVTIVGATQNDDGSYTVVQGQEYEIICAFAESSMHQFDNDAVLTYHMPAGIVISEEQMGQMEISITYKGRVYQIDTSYDLKKDGTLEIQFDPDDPDYHRLVESTNVGFRFLYHASFDGNETHIRFSSEIERDLVFTDPEPGDAFVKKTGWYDEENGIFHYTVKVTATGDIQDVNVRDDLIGNALVFNNDVVVTGNSSSYTNNGSSSGFNYTFDSMQEGEEVTITYSAHVNFGADGNNDGKITADQTKNSVRVEPEPGDPHTSEYSREIRYKYAVKNKGQDNGETVNGDKIIDWSIDYNPLALGSAAGDVITDAIASDSVAYMKYHGSGITIEVRDHSGNLIRTDNVTYASMASHSDSSWSYVIPSTDTEPYSYHITYQTIVDMAAVEGEGVAITLTNTANNSSNSVSILPEHAVIVDKEVESYTTEEINWVATFTIPTHGLTSAVVEDTLPGRYFDGATHYDLFDQTSLQVDGLLPGEEYAMTYDPITHKVIVRFFYHTESGDVDGLKPSSSVRDVHVRLKTLTDQDWLEKGYENTNFATHSNMISFNGVIDTANVIYGKPGIEKIGERIDDETFLYTIIISGLKSDHFEMNDTFDTNILEVDTSKVTPWERDHMYMYGGTQYSQIAGKTPVSYTDTADGIHLSVNNVPKDQHGQYYSHYKIAYYLKLKDGVDFEALAKAHGGKYDLVNTAVWGRYDSSFTYKVRYDYLIKELVNKDELGGLNRVAQYKITFNPAKVTLNGGQPMTMQDVLSPNLSVDYSSIHIETDPENVEVPYVLRGGVDESDEPDGTTVATYTVPDSTKVIITYDAFVRGDGLQTISNEVSILEEEEVVTHTEEYGEESEGQGAVASFKIVKVDGYNANKKLEGVWFKVFAENPELDFGEDSDYAKEILLKTDANGEIILDGDRYDFYFDERYHVQEVDPLPGYARIGFDYLVTLTSDMSRVNYGRYIYYYNDSMQIKNYPLEGLVVEKQVDSSEPQDKTRKYTFRVSILNADGTVDTSYNEGNEDYQFENGVYEFQLKHNEQKMFWGFDRGTRYKVEELDADGFATSITYSVYDEDGNVIDTNTEQDTVHTNTLTQTEELVVFKNSKEDHITPTGIANNFRILLFVVLVVFVWIFARTRRSGCYLSGKSRIGE